LRVYWNRHAVAITETDAARVVLTARVGAATGRVELDVPEGTTKRGVAIVVK
jgi:hypothetical protein